MSQTSFSRISVEPTALEDEDSVFLMARRQICLQFRIIKVMCLSKEKVEVGLLNVPSMTLGVPNLCP